jgi:RNA polymerase sigma-70 factor, ECF subfamily
MKADVSYNDLSPCLHPKKIAIFTSFRHLFSFYSINITENRIRMTEHPERFPQTITEFSSFIRQHQNRLVRYAFFRIGNKEEAEDIVQNVMVALFCKQEKIRHIDKPVPYLFRMVGNACIDHLRKKPNAGSVSTDEIRDIPVDGADREKEIIAREEYERVNQLLGGIPGEQAEVIRMRIFDELSFTEIAEIMETPVTTVKSRFSYGIIKLRNKTKSKEELRYELH